MAPAIVPVASSDEHDDALLHATVALRSIVLACTIFLRGPPWQTAAARLCNRRCRRTPDFLGSLFRLQQGSLHPLPGAVRAHRAYHHGEAGVPRTAGNSVGGAAGPARRALPGRGGR